MEPSKSHYRLTKGTQMRQEMTQDSPILRTLQTQVRSQAAGIRWSVQAHLEEEGQDHQEAGAEAGVHRVQVEESVPHQENQALRARRREEAKGTDDPVLTCPLVATARACLKH